MKPGPILIAVGIIVIALAALNLAYEWVLFGFLFIAAGFMSMKPGGIKMLNKLDRGMTLAQVKQILGEPKQKEVKADKTVYKYGLHEWMSGWKPVYLAFGEDGQLLEWFVNEDEYLERQKLWLKALKEVNKNIRKD